VAVVDGAAVGVAAAALIAEVASRQPGCIVPRVGERDSLPAVVVAQAGDTALGLGDGEQLAQAVVSRSVRLPPGLRWPAAGRLGSSSGSRRRLGAGR
jgi:hypothetical protein